MRQAARVDANQSPIIAGLRKAGCTVEVIGKPLDLLVGRAGLNYLLEVKNASGRDQIEPGQAKFLREWNGQAAVVHSLQDALAVVGLMKAND